MTASTANSLGCRHVRVAAQCKRAATFASGSRPYSEMPSRIHEAALARPPGRNASVDRNARLCQDWGMDLEVVRKALSKRSAFSSKRVAFFVVALSLIHI